MRKVAWGQWLLWLCVIVALAFALVPIAWTMLCSFQPQHVIYSYPPRWIPENLFLDNYKTILQRTSIPRDLLNSVIICSASVTITLFCSSLFAYALSRSRYNNRRKSLLVLVILIAQMVPPVILIIPLYLIVGFLHLLNTYAALILVYPTHIMPLSIIMLTAFYDSIPKALDESARIDGCNSFRIFRLLFKLTLPGLAAMMILGAVITFNEFIVAVTLISETTKKTYQVGLYNILAQLWDHTFVNFAHFDAASMLGLVPLLLAYIFSHKYFIAGMTQGSIK